MDATRHIALLRAVNVGGTGRLPMTDFKAMCIDAGFGDVQTYIASGTAVFTTPLPEAEIKAALEFRLTAYAGKPIATLVRQGTEMAEILAECPFTDVPSQQVAVLFLNEAPPADTIARTTGRNGEEIHLGRRELHIHYPMGMGVSKLRIPAAVSGTIRNLNTVAKLVALASRK